MGAGVQWRGFKSKCDPGLVFSDRIQVCEGFPSQGCSLIWIVSDWVCQGIRTMFMVLSAFAFTILLDSSLHSPAHS